MATKSKVWCYFDVNEADNTKAVCTTCKTRISRGGVGKAASTSALLKHVKHKHPELYVKIKPSSEEHELGTLTTSSVKQTKVDDYLKIKKWDINDKRAKELHNAIGRMTAVDSQPISIVTDMGKSQITYLVDKY